MEAVQVSEKSAGFVVKSELNQNSKRNIGELAMGLKVNGMSMNIDANVEEIVFIIFLEINRFFHFLSSRRTKISSS